jgi:hypothetical protein
MSDPIGNRVIRMHTAAVVCADRGMRLTYGELAAYIGRPGEQGALDSDFALWAKWLRSKSLPPLYVIVINRETGKPGRNCDVPPENVPEEQAKCYLHDWRRTPQPTMAELESLQAETKDAA